MTNPILQWSEESANVTPWDGILPNSFFVQCQGFSAAELGLDYSPGDLLA